MNEIQNPLGQVSGIPPVSALPQKNVLGLVLKIVGLVIVVAAVGGGASLATRVWDPLWNPFRPDPEKVISQMMDKMEQVKTRNFALEMTLVGKGLKIKGTIETAESFNYSFKLNGVSDVSDSSKPQSAFNFDISGQAAPGRISLVGEMAGIGTDLYFNLKKIEVPGAEEALLANGIDLNQIKNQWIKIDQDLLKTLTAGVVMTQETTEQQKGALEKMTKLLTENQFYYIKQELPDEKINGQKVYHYLLALDKDKIIKTFIPEFVKISMEGIKGIKGIEGIDSYSVFITSMISQLVDNFFKAVGDVSFDYLISKKDELLYRFNLEKEIDVSKFDKTAKGIIALKIKLDQSDFDKPINVSAPANAKTLEQIFPFLQQEIKKQKIDMLMRNLFWAAIKIGTENNGNYATFTCENSEVADICSLIKTVIDVEPVIHSSSQKFCSYAKLPSTDNTYICFTNSGVVSPVVKPDQVGYCDGKTFKCPGQFFPK